MSTPSTANPAPATPLLRCEQHGVLRGLVGNHPPVNALSQPVRQGLLDALAAAHADVNTRAVLVRCEGRTFFAGADIDELDQGLCSPGLLEFVQAADRTPKPLVAALHGTVFGGGVVVAYACDHRIAAVGTRFAMPEVSLGLLPTFGGTQLLPRWLGIEAALRLVIDGEPWSAEQALAAGLIDAIVPAERLIEAAQALALSSPTKRRVRDAQQHLGDADVGRSAFDARRKRLAASAPDFEAAALCLDVMQCGLALPLDEALAQEHEAFLHLLASAQSRRLRRLFMAERRLRRSGVDVAAVAQTLREAGLAALRPLAERLLQQGSVGDAALLDAIIVQAFALPRHLPSPIADLMEDPAR